MIQLTYQPALDPFHAIFRLMRLRRIVANFGPLDVGYVRILDFYLLFPFRIDEIRLAQKHRRYKALASTYSGLRPYGDLPASNVLFERMKPMEEAAMETMVRLMLFDSEAFRISRIADTERPSPPEIEERVAEVNDAQADLLAFLGLLVTEYPFLGDQGIKARTGLLEYRYDSV